MQRRFVRKMVSTAMALVLVFTSNSASFQPLLARADTGTQHASASISAGAAMGASEDAEGLASAFAGAVPRAADEDAADNVAGATGEGSAGSVSGAIGEDVESDAASDAVAGGAADSSTNAHAGAALPAEKVGCDFAGLAWVDAEGMAAHVEESDGSFDLSRVDVADIASLELSFSFEGLFRAGNVVHAGDYVALSFPAPLKLNVAQTGLVLAGRGTPSEKAIASYRVEGNTIKAVFDAAVEDGSFGTSSIAELSVSADLDEAALNPNEVSVVTITLGSKALETTVILPAATSLAVDSPARGIEEGVAKQDDEAADFAIAPLSVVMPLAADGQTARLEKEWIDNNDAKRPWQAIATDGTLGVWFSIDGSPAKKIDATTMGEVGLSAVPAIVASESGTSHAVYSCAGLPSQTEGKQSITYEIKEDAAKALQHGYRQEVNAKGVLCNVQTTSFAAQVILHDGANQDASVIPAEAFALYRQGSGGLEKVADPDVFWDASKKEYAAVDVPRYNLDGTEIVYCVQATPPAASADDYFYVEYDNAAVANHGTDLSACFDGGVISLTRAGEATYTGTKAWLDDSDVENRPDAAFYLWRYTQKGANGFKEASQVRDDSNRPLVVELKGASKNDDRFTFTIAGGLTEGLASLPKYDAEGYPYVYLTREVLLGDTANLYEQVFGSVDPDSFVVADTLPDGVARQVADKSLYNGGTLSNRRAGSLSVPGEKSWQASVYQNKLLDVRVVMVLQQRPAGSTDETDWKDTAHTKTLTGFKAEAMKIAFEDSASQYDELGRALEYRWVESKIIDEAGNELVLGPDGAFKLVCNPPDIDDPANERRDVEHFESTIFPIDASDPSKGTSVVNRLVGTVDYTIDKIWKDSSGAEVVAPAGASVQVQLYQNDMPMDNRLYTLDGRVDDNQAGGGETEPWHVYINDLPKYDEQGSLYTYAAEEATGVEGYFSDYNYDVDKRMTTITNTPGEGGNLIRVEKTWIDDGDIDHRYPVRVEVRRNSDKSLAATTTLDTANNWWSWVSVDAGTTYKDYYLKETAYVKSESESFPVDDAEIPAVRTDHHLYQVAYSTDDARKVLEVTNKRIGIVDMQVTKTWLDEGADPAQRPGAALQLVCDEYPDAVDYAADVVTLPGGGPLPILDKEGKPVAARQEVDRAPASGIEQLYYFYNLPKYDDRGKVVHYSIKEVPYDQAAFDAKDYAYSIASDAYDVGGAHTDDVQKATVANKRSAVKDIEFHKLWKDAYAYQNGKRPDIYLTLWQVDSTNEGKPFLVNGTGFAEYQWTARTDSGVVLDAANAWTAKIPSVPKYDANGFEITYYAQESTNGAEATFDYTPVSYKGDTVAVGGSTAGNALKEGGTFVNALENAVIIEGRKFWKSIPQGFPAAQLPHVTVLVGQALDEKDENPTEVARLTGLETLEGTNDFAFQVIREGENNPDAGVKLPKYNDEGELYVYKIKEQIEGKPADPSITSWTDLYTMGGTVFTLENVFNTSDGNVGSLKVSKTWANHPDGRPYPAATFKLHRAYVVNGQSEPSDEVIDAKTLASSASANDVGEVVFENLFVYAPDGQKYQYWVEEEGVDGYTSEVVDITKGSPAKLTAGSTAAASVKNTYDEKGSIELSGEKVWEDYGDAFGQRPQDIVLALHRWADEQPGQSNGIPDEMVTVDDAPVKLAWNKEGNTWSYTYTGLERYAPNGTAWKYKVVEQGGTGLAPYGLDAGAAKTVNAGKTDAATGSIAMKALTNALSTEAAVAKKWEDGNDAYGLRPTAVSVKLQVKAGDADWEDASVVFKGVSGMDAFGEIELNAKNSWSHAYSKLPSAKVAKNQDGTTSTTSYAYRFAEIEIGGAAGIEIQQDGRYAVTDGKKHTYTPSGTVAGSTTTITNTMQDTGKTSLTVKKEWVNDNNDAFGTRPKKAGMSDGTWEIAFALERTIDASDQDSWEEVKDAAGQRVVRSLSGSASDDRKSATFENLPKFDVAGNEYVYRARELPVTGYATTSTYAYADSAGVANSTAFANALEVKAVQGSKTWIDDDNARPADVQLTLYRQLAWSAKEEVPSAPSPVWTKTDANVWEYAYPEVLPRYDRNGNEYIYTVAETVVADGYWVAYSTDGLSLTNTQTKFKVDKVDAAGAAGTTPVPVNDVTLSIYKKGADASSAPIATWTRDANGKVAITGAAGSSVAGEDDSILGLPQGDYVLRETKTPAAYVTASDIPFTLKADGTLSSTTDGAVTGDLADGITLTMKNRLAKGHVKLTKTVADDKAGTVEGVEFSLYKKGSPDKLLSEHLTTDDKGAWSSEAVFPDGLEVGSYCFVETKATDDTVLSNGRVDFEVKNTDDGKTIAVTAANTAFAASLELNKLDGTTGDALAGAVFELSCKPASGGAETKSVLTSTDGTFKADNLKKGAYTLKETKLPSGYEGAFEATFTLADADNGKTVVARDGKVGAAEVAAAKTAGTWSAGGITNARILGSLSLAKVATGTGEGLQGAEFMLTGPDGYEKILTTDAKGKLSATDLAWGAYSVTETKAPAGYVLGEKPWAKTFVVGPAASGVQLAWDFGAVDNAPTRASLMKVDDANPANPVEGANLVLEGAFANTTETKLAWTSAQAPWVLENRLIAGNEYTLSETGRVNGYLALGKAAVKFKVGDDGRITVTENPKLVDGADAASVSSDGLALSLRNIKIAGGVELTKTDDGEAPLKGVTFDLYAAGADKPLHKDLTTDADGKIKIEGLIEGSYYFVETATLDGKVLDPAQLVFSIGEADHAKVKPLQMSNGDFRSAVSLMKVDATSGDALAGVQFTLSKQNAAGEFAPVGNPVVTNENGAVLFPLTEKGMYRVQETAAAVGYALDADKPYTATFTMNNTADFQDKTLELSESVDADTAQKYNLVVENALHKDGKVANERKLGSVALEKVDADTGAGLDGVEFSLFAADDPARVLGVFATGNAYAAPDDDAPTATGDGEVSIAGLGWGSYFLQETKANNGYQLASDKFEFMIEAGNAGSAPSVDLGTVANATIEFSFSKMELYAESCSDASLGAEAADATRPLAGAEFTVFTDEACSAIAKSAAGDNLVAASDSAGEVSFSLVKVGTYYVKETAVPGGHQQNDAVYQLVVKEDGTVERFSLVDDAGGVLEEIVNDVNRADIRIKKVSENDEGKVLPNSMYGLYRRTASSDGNLARTRVSPQAVDIALEPDLQLIAKATTGPDGYLAFEGILMGQEYVIRELVAPDGSLVSEHPVAITFMMVDGQAKITSFDDGSGTAEVDANGTVVWKEPQVIVDFAKKNPEGELLAGATLQVVDKNDAVVVEPWVSEASVGHRVEGVLAAGESYRLVELAAPDGYVEAAEVPFTVDDRKRGPQEGYVQHVEMTDERAPVALAKGPFSFLVKTGDALAGALAGGVALAAAGIAAAVSLRRRRKRL